ncbi:hypothetical protein Tco_0295700 [Tanacetum coccineum]
MPNQGFTELHQLDTFYNGLNPSDQDSLNSAAGGNVLERSAQDVLKIIENKSKVQNSRNKPIVSQVKASNVDSLEIASVVASAVTSAMTTMYKQHQVTPAPASVKAVEESCVTCGGAHSYRQCPAIDDNIFSGYQDNIQGYVLAAAKTNEASRQAMRNHISNLKSELRSEMQSTMQNQNNAFKNELTNDIKNMMASFFQINTASSSGSGSLPSNTIANPKGELKAIITRSGIVLYGPSILMPLLFINPKEDERAEETLTDPKLVEYTIKVPPPLVQKPQAPSQKIYEMPKRDPLHPNIPYPSRIWTTSRTHNDAVSINRIDVIDVACEEYAQEVLGFADSFTSGNPTPSLDPIHFPTSSTLTTLLKKGDIHFRRNRSLSYKRFNSTGN